MGARSAKRLNLRRTKTPTSKLSSTRTALPPLCTPTTKFTQTTICTWERRFESEVRVACGWAAPELPAQGAEFAAVCDIAIQQKNNKDRKLFSAVCTYDVYEPNLTGESAWNQETTLSGSAAAAGKLTKHTSIDDIFIEAGPASMISEVFPEDYSSSSTSDSE